ncbi:hypothetical protein G6F50_013320 [Rhizopus delemar]|uniref:Uncharacterized protein n=1 Tax=Rhizopus delemar TaxID=936053 RepID=A0A9P7CE91_9FUNG|nr:hypothetical protein G6F50_013320 [Rhizopus delemar]
MRGDLAVQCRLVAQQLVQAARGDRLAQAELQLPVDELVGSAERAVCAHRVNHLHGRGQVHPQGHLVAAQQFLAGHVQRTRTQLHALHRHIAVEVPERVQAGVQRLPQRALNEQQADRLARHGADHRYTRQHAQLAQALLHVRRNARLVTQRHHAHLGVDRTPPVQTAAARRQDFIDAAIAQQQADLGSTDVGQHEVRVQPCAQCLDQAVLVAAGVGRALRCGVDVHLRAAAEGRQAVHARQQDLLETTVAIHQAALAVADHDLDGPEHGILSLYGSGGSTRWDETS